MELELELQEKITEAALKLAKDPTVAKSVRKKRKQSYHKSSQKVSQDVIIAQISMIEVWKIEQSNVLFVLFAHACNPDVRAKFRNTWLFRWRVGKICQHTSCARDHGIIGNYHIKEHWSIVISSMPRVERTGTNIILGAHLSVSLAF